MPIVRPLRALRYGPDQAELMPQLISPAVTGEPVDRSVVGDVHEWNVRQLVRGERGPLASDDEPPFTHAARLLQRWKRRGVMVRDPRPALYPWEQRVGESTRRGLVCLVRLNEVGHGPVLPHEHIDMARSARLVGQLEALSTQVSLAMALVPDDGGELKAYLDSFRYPAPLFLEDGKGVQNRLWRDESPERLIEVQALLRDRPAVIADGHHRYGAALLHQQRQRTAEGRRARGERPYDYMMMMLVPLGDPGLRSRASHRVYGSLSPAAEALLASVSEHFEAHEVADHDALRRSLDEPGPLRLAVVRPGSRTLLTLRDPQDAALASLPAPLRGVDTAEAGALLLDELARLQADAPSDDVAYNALSAQEAADAAFAGELALAVLLRATPPEQVVSVARAGQLLPRKSTNFQPKLGKGLVLASLRSF